MSSTKTFFEAVKERRTIYQLNKEAPISDKQISDIAEKAILHVPSSFNSQSTRLVVLLNKDHETFWDFVLEVLKPLTPEENFPQTEQKINGFKGAYGTVSPSLFHVPSVHHRMHRVAR
jgi:predicted oxidoreductase (fatty acid repression mutant protein)